MDEVRTLDLGHGYTGRIHYEDDAYNPLKEYDATPKIIMYAKAARHVDWVTDDDLAERLDYALEHGRISMDHTLKVFVRWVKTYYDVAAILPFSLLDHSSLHVYLGTHDHPADYGGWDSAWVGFILVTKTQLAEWGCPPDATDKEILLGHFKEFSSWVEGDVYGYTIDDPDGNELDDSCWGFYGDEPFAERLETEMVLTQEPLPGWVIKTHLGDMTINGVEKLGEIDGHTEWGIQYDGGAAAGTLTHMEKFTMVHPGHALEEMRLAVAQDWEARCDKRNSLFRRLVGAR